MKILLADGCITFRNWEMNIFSAVAILQLLLVVKGSDVPGERKRVGCYYLGDITERYGTLSPEDIDASICTHLNYVHGAINYETQEIYLKSPTPKVKTGGEGYIPRIVKLKEENPDLKLFLYIPFTPVAEESSNRSNIIQSGIKWLNESGFDGLDIDLPAGSQEMEEMANFVCEMKNEFQKYGFLIMTSLNGAALPGEEITRIEEVISKINRCSDLIGLVTHLHEREQKRISPMSEIKSNVDEYIERGVPASKILITIPAFGLILREEDSKDTERKAKIYKPGNDDPNMMGGLGIRNKELLRKLNNSSLEWTIRRDNETQEPSASSTTGLMTSYEDTTSMEYKARYVMQKGLGGINVVAMDFEDDEGIGGEGRFPLTRAVYNTFRK